MPAAKGSLVEYMVTKHKISQRQACKAVSLPQSSSRYKRRPKKYDALISELRLLVDKHPSIGFWQSYYRIRRKGFNWNHKRLYRVYTDMKLNIRRRYKKRLPERVKQSLFHPQNINEVWSIDFMDDTLWDGRKFRLLNIVDYYNREILHIERDTSLEQGG